MPVELGVAAADAERAAVDAGDEHAAASGVVAFPDAVAVVVAAAAAVVAVVQRAVVAAVAATSQNVAAASEHSPEGLQPASSALVLTRPEDAVHSYDVGMDRVFGQR